MAMTTMAPKIGTDAPTLGKGRRDDVVEVALLLPANRAEALVAMSRRRQESVGQILRSLIDRALDTDE